MWVGCSNNDLLIFILRAGGPDKLRSLERSRSKPKVKVELSDLATRNFIIMSDEDLPRRKKKRRLNELRGRQKYLKDRQNQFLAGDETAMAV